MSAWEVDHPKRNRGSLTVEWNIGQVFPQGAKESSQKPSLGVRKLRKKRGGVMSGSVFALSIKQPWAGLILAGVKTVEIRTWSTAIRGRVLIHAASRPDERPEAWKWVTEEVKPFTQLHRGIIGEAILSGCVIYREKSVFHADQLRHWNDPEWFQSPQMYGFEFTQPKVLSFRACRGYVRFFHIEESANQ